MGEKIACLLLSFFLLNGFFLNARETFTITGRIDLNNTYDLDVLLDRMEKADIKSPQEWGKLFFSLRKSLPRINYDKVTVYLSGNGEKQKTKILNQYGRYRFDNVPAGEYTITAEVPFESSRKNFFLKKLSANTVVFAQDRSETNLFLDMEGVTLKGRLIDQNGGPIPNGEILVMDPDRLHILKAVSNRNGDFILNGIQPVTYFFVSNYLSEEVSLYSLRKEIQISAKGYKTPKKYQNLEILMVTEDMVVRAKRFISINEQILKRMGTPKEIKIQERTFPPSQGNTILLGDIILYRK